MMSQDNHWQIQIQTLTQQESWAELDALYENLIAQVQDPSQRLFYIWERAGLLCDQCYAFHQAVHLLQQAALQSSLLDIIVPKIEEVRVKACEYQQGINDASLLTKIMSTYQLLMQNFPNNEYLEQLQYAYNHTQNLFQNAEVSSQSFMHSHHSTTERTLDVNQQINSIEEVISSHDSEIQNTSTIKPDHDLDLRSKPIVKESLLPSKSPVIVASDLASPVITSFATIDLDSDPSKQADTSPEVLESDQSNNHVPHLEEIHTSTVDSELYPQKVSQPRITEYLTDLDPSNSNLPVALPPQDTALEVNTPDMALLDQLLMADPRVNPIAFMVDLESLCQLRALSFEEQTALEKPLWIATESKHQWRKWTQLYGRYFAPNSADPSIAAQRTFKLASIYETYLQENTTAVDYYLEVLGYEPEHIEAFDRLYVILSDQKRWKELTEVISQVVLHRSQSNERFDLYLLQGDLYRNQLNSHAKAVSSWFQALELEPESRQIFVRLLEIYQQTEKWNASIKVLKKLVKLESDLEKKAYYTYTIGLIYRDQIKDHYLAVRTFDEALNSSPQFLKAFQAIDDILTQEKDIARKDRYYRKMLIRAVNHDFEPSMIAEIALQVGELNLQLHEWQEAKRAYELVLNYRPSDVQAFQNLNRIYLHIDGAAEAIQNTFHWIRRHPTHIEAYQSLYRLTADHGRFDWAWCVANVLHVLNIAEGESHRFLTEGQSRMSTRLQRALNPAEWKMLIWAQQDSSWSKMIALSNSMTQELLTQKAKVYKIHLKKDKINTKPNYTFGRVIHYISTHLNFSMPTLWASKFMKDQVLEIVNLSSVGLLLDERVLSNKNVEEMVAYLTYGLYLAQSQFWIIASNNAESNISNLKELALWSMQFKQNQSKSSPVKISKIEQSLWFNKHKNISDVQRERLLQLPDLDANQAQAWIAGVEQSAYRLALLMSARLNIVVDLIKNQPSISGDSFETRLYKLLLFAVSPAYIELRQSLQLTLSVET
jgi:tetratricopeptide (TPR) repeat protein